LLDQQIHSVRLSLAAIRRAASGNRIRRCGGAQQGRRRHGRAARCRAQIVPRAHPDADIVEADFSKVPFDRVLDTGRFDFEKAQQHPLWYKELYGFADHAPDTEQ